MNAKQCDRCGKFYKAAPDIEEIIVGERRGDDIIGIDFCPVCYRQLYKWYKREKSRPAAKRPAVEVPELNGGFIFK